MKILFILSACLLMIACGGKVSEKVIDQCMRREIFAQCMKLLPKGPVTTHENDWADVVQICDKIAYAQSARHESFIKPECRAF